MSKTIYYLMENFKDYVQYSAAILTPILAVVTITSHIINYRLAQKRRNDDLFNRRYQFLLSFEKLWRTTGNEKDGATKMSLEWDDLAPFIDEAQYLFANDIVEHLRAYENKSCKERITWVPDSKLRKPFNKYLKFKKW